MGALSRTRRRRPRSSPGCRDERGGAISLWVLLMVPVSAFAAVVAMAGPQRLAAESSVQEAAEDLAVFAVASRDGQQNFVGPLHAFPTECSTQGQRTHSMPQSTATRPRSTFCSHRSTRCRQAIRRSRF